MTIENASVPSELDASLPAGTDFLREGDNHIKLIKQVFKNFADTVTGKATSVEAAEQTTPSDQRYMTVLKTFEAITARIPTQTVAETASDNVKVMTPLRTKQQIDARLVTNSQATAGTDSTRLMTSLRTFEQVTARIPDQTTAEAGTDQTKILSVLRGAQLAKKVFDDNFNLRRASEAEAIAGSLDDKLMTPLKSRQHGDARYLRLDQTTPTSRAGLAGATSDAIRSGFGFGNAALGNRSNSTSSTSQSDVATSLAVKNAYDKIPYPVAGSNFLVARIAEYTRSFGGQNYVFFAAGMVIVPGTVRVYLEHRAPSSNTSYARVLINGSVVVEWSTTSSGFVARTVDVSVNPGDILEVQTRSSNDFASEIRNYRIYSQFNMGCVVPL